MGEVALLRESQRARLNEAKKKVEEELKAAHDEIVNVKASETAVRMELQVMQEDIAKLNSKIEELKAKIAADAERRKANLRKLEEATAADEVRKSIAASAFQRIMDVFKQWDTNRDGVIDRK